MTEVHQKIINEIVNKYKKNKSVIAITLFGSLASGEEKKDSDVDIGIISDKGKKWRWFKNKKYGIHIDFTICAKSHLFYQLEKYPYLCYFYLDNKILYDPTSFMKRIKKRIRNYLKKHPEVVKFWKEKLKSMKKNKAKGQDPKEAIKSYDEAEILFSDEHKVTRNFFRE